MPLRLQRKWPFITTEAENISQSQINAAYRQKYRDKGYNMSGPISQRSEPLLQRRDRDADEEDPTCIKIKYTLGTALIVGGAAFLVGWLRPWVSNNDNGSPTPILPPPINNGTICPPVVNNTFSCPTMSPYSDFNDVLVNGTVTDTGRPAGFDGYSLKIWQLQITPTVAKVIAGIPALTNDPNNDDLRFRTSAFLHRPYLTTGVNFPYYTPDVPNACLYRIGQWLAPEDATAYVPLAPGDDQAPAIYLAQTPPNGLTQDELVEKFMPNKNKTSHAELNLFTKQSKHSKLDKLQREIHELTTPRL